MGRTNIREHHPSHLIHYCRSEGQAENVTQLMYSTKVIAVLGAELFKWRTQKRY